MMLKNSVWQQWCYTMCTNTFTHLKRFTCIIKILDKHTRTLTHYHTNAHAYTCKHKHKHKCMFVVSLMNVFFGHWEDGIEIVKHVWMKCVSLLYVNSACSSVGVYRNRKWYEYIYTIKHNSWFNTTLNVCMYCMYSKPFSRLASALDNEIQYILKKTG